MTKHYSRNKRLTQNQFYDILCERLKGVQFDHDYWKQQAQSIAREAGKSYEEIMVSYLFSLYIKFD